MAKDNEEKKRISLSTLARRYRVNKSRLRFYVDMGFLTPVGEFGRTQLFDDNDATVMIGEIFRLRDSGKSIEEVRGELKRRKLIK